MWKWQFLYPQGEKSTHSDWTSHIDLSREGWDDGGDLVVQRETGHRPATTTETRSEPLKEDGIEAKGPQGRW